MTKETYDTAMAYLDVIEVELNKIAKEAGHCSYEEFRELEKQDDIKQAA